MPLTRREKQGYGTAGVGAGLVYSGAQTTERGIQRGLQAAGLPHKEGRPALPGIRALKDSRGLKGAGKTRALYAGGNLMRTVGTVGVLAGASEAVRGRKWRKDNPNNKIIAKGFIREGIQGNLQASHQKLTNLKEKKPVGAMAIPVAVGIGGGTAGSKIAHTVMDRSKFKGSGKRAGITALAGIAGVAASAPLSNKALAHKYPDYKLTPTGVQRRKTAPVKPSSKAAQYDQRQGGAAFRNAIVGKSDVSKMGEALGAKWTSTLMRAPKLNMAHPKRSPMAFRQGQVKGALRRTGNKLAVDATPLARPLEALTKALSDGQKRARIYAAGSIPVVGDFAAASAARSLAPKQQQNKAYATQLAGNLGGSTGGALAGAAIAGETARRSPKARGKLVAANNYVEGKKKALLKPVTDRLPKRNVAKPGAAGAARSVLAKIPKIPTPARYAGLGGALAVGGLAGQVVGGQVGGYKATSRNLAREKTIAKALIEINTHKPKYETTIGQDKKAIRQRKKVLLANTAGATVGTAGLSTFVASRAVKSPSLKAKLAGATVGLGATGGGVGAYGGFKRVKVEHGDLRRQEKAYAERRQSTFGKSETLRRHARKGEATVRLKTLDPYRRAPGLRWKNKEYTAVIARQMKEKGYDPSRPVHVQLWNGKEVFVDDGAHRMWAADMAGVKKVPIKITRHTGVNPRKGSGPANRFFDDVRTSRFHAQRRRTTGLSQHRLDSLARNKPTGWQKRQNDNWAARGEKRATGRGRLVAVA